MNVTKFQQVKRSNEYRMRQSFWVPEPCFDPHIPYLYVETKQNPYECNTCSNDESIKFDKIVFIIMNSNLIQYISNKNQFFHTSTLKKT
jgi:hypothetical protein